MIGKSLAYDREGRLFVVREGREGGSPDELLAAFGHPIGQVPRRLVKLRPIGWLPGRRLGRLLHFPARSLRRRIFRKRDIQRRGLIGRIVWSHVLK